MSAGKFIFRISQPATQSIVKRKSHIMYYQHLSYVINEKDISE